MASIQHIFVSGLRFQTEVQYESTSRHGLRWQKLPTPPPHQDGGAAICMAQCLALQGQIPRAKAMSLYRQLHRTAMTDATSAKTHIDALALEITVSVFVADHPASYGHMALHSIKKGGICLLHYASKRGVHWSVVVGVESIGTATSPEALLLLDTNTDEPWACGHNARIELQHAKQPITRKGAGLICRSLTGAASTVRPLDMLIFQTQTD